jgi:hypothetical protein
MSESSWMMGGGRMRVEVDDQKGQAVGSHIRLAGTALGLHLSVDEIVTRREPPALKVWSTVGSPRLLIIGAYTMGLEISTNGRDSRLRVFIDYDLPDSLFTRWLGVCFGGFYARWCVNHMLADTAKHFALAGAMG